jgi:hypothetical protein
MVGRIFGGDVAGGSTLPPIWISGQMKGTSL